MAIIEKERYFGEGISSYGEEDARVAFNSHLCDVRVKRLIDLIGSDAKLSPGSIVAKFEDIVEAINCADNQVRNDNSEFIVHHNISFSVKEWKA